MSLGDGHPQTLLRPIPIHLPRPAGLDPFRSQFPVFPEKPDKPFRSIWNPAYDLCFPHKESDIKLPADLSVKADLTTTKMTSNSLLTSLSTSVKISQAISAVPMNTVFKSLKRAQPSFPTAANTQSTINNAPPKQTMRPLLNSQQNPMAFFASKKDLFPVIFEASRPNLCDSMHSPTAKQLELSIAENHKFVHSEFTQAQFRVIMERPAPSHPKIPRQSIGQQEQLHPRHLLNQHNQQQTPCSQQNPVPQVQSFLPIQEMPMSMQSVLTLTPSRTLLGRINASHQMLFPANSRDSVMGHGYGRKLFPCLHCRYTTDRRNNLKRHMLTMHQTSARMLECCGIIFNTKASLREHAMVFHYHGYTCYFCGRRFCRKALLKRHLSVHNGQKDFICDVCDYATSHKSNLERHRKVHSRQDDGKDGESEQRYHRDDKQLYHEDGRSNGSEAVSHGDVSADELSVCSDYDDDDDEDTDVEINVHSD